MSCHGDTSHCHGGGVSPLGLLRATGDRAPQAKSPGGFLPLQLTVHSGLKEKFDVNPQ
jgi:hypothetical protein